MTNKLDEKRKGADPLVIMNQYGDVEAVLACNGKSRAKSLEQSELWVLRPNNGRVLPWRGGGVSCGTFTRHDSDGEPQWYEVCVNTTADTAEPDRPESTAEPETPARSTATETPADSGQPLTIPVLSPLADLIAERRRTMPEGSYTTHLFSKGASKIRKKTGEEAVELLLAATREDIVAETADLFYHAMVLLEEENIRVEEVVAELKRRHER